MGGGVWLLHLGLLWFVPTMFQRANCAAPFEGALIRATPEWSCWTRWPSGYQCSEIKSKTFQSCLSSEPSQKFTLRGKNPIWQWLVFALQLDLKFSYWGSLKILLPGVVAHTCGPRAQEQRQEHSSEFETSPGYIVKSCLKKKKIPIINVANTGKITSSLCNWRQEVRSW